MCHLLSFEVARNRVIEEQVTHCHSHYQIHAAPLLFRETAQFVALFPRKPRGEAEAAHVGTCSRLRPRLRTDLIVVFVSFFTSGRSTATDTLPAL